MLNERLGHIAASMDNAPDNYASERVKDGEFEAAKENSKPDCGNPAAGKSDVDDGKRAREREPCHEQKARPRADGRM